MQPEIRQKKKIFGWNLHYDTSIFIFIFVFFAYCVQDPVSLLLHFGKKSFRKDRETVART